MESTQKRQVAIAVFVKTPGLSPIKTRLAEAVGSENSKRFYRASAAVVSATLRRCKERSRSERLIVQPFWAIAELSTDTIVPENVIAYWKDLPYVAQGGGSLGQRMKRVYETLITLYDAVILVGADCPQIAESVVMEAVEVLSGEANDQAVIGLASDGGFYLVGSNSLLDNFAWEEPVYSTDKAGEVMVAELEKSCRVCYLEQSFDVDTFGDLQRLQELLVSTGGRSKGLQGVEGERLAEIVAELCAQHR